MTDAALESVCSAASSSQEGERRAINPATGAVATVWRPASTALVDTALSQAAQAQIAWAKVAPAERAALLRDVADAIDANAASFAHDDSKENGRLLRSLRHDDVPSAADLFRDAADRVQREKPMKECADDGVLIHRRVPHGVCVGIGAWNYPLVCAAAKMAPALACGNAMVFKPAPQTPSSAHRLGTLVRERLARRSSNLVHACSVLLGDDAVGQRLVCHPLVRFVSATGSVSTGQRIFANSAASLKRLVLELGGKSALIVLDDADIDIAVDVALHANFVAHGQLCTAASRLLVHRSRQREFSERFLERVRGLVVGPPDSAQSEIGPLVSEDHAQSVLAKVRAAVDRGANLVAGALKPVASQPTQSYLAPMVLDDVDASDPLLTQEIFGPVACILPLDDVDHAVDQANAVNYGLSAGVVGANVARATTIAQRLHAGVVWVNTYNEQPLAMAFGGMGWSGIGREGGDLGFAAYSEPQALFVGAPATPSEGFVP